ncbi:hypothetical protein XA68_11309 [Ophiocordyceps unilateralis]|uniref:Uncharacterized protein n=1 Tax=Ophiocordyceps unilateralis TaxID=268505 RepID=A0A2A9PH37_OPHUN|nr:hypothetical protein XA68_11309 [Ophiocordyceps unilateralis]
MRRRLGVKPRLHCRARASKSSDDVREREEERGVFKQGGGGWKGGHRKEGDGGVARDEAAGGRRRQHEISRSGKASRYGQWHTAATYLPSTRISNRWSSIGAPALSLTTTYHDLPPPDSGLSSSQMHRDSNPYRHDLFLGRLEERMHVSLPRLRQGDLMSLKLVSGPSIIPCRRL